ncbi:MAG: hypothetical protein ACI9TV_001596 [Sulfurimonas sp.]|jgi:hypothetical protein
MICAEFKTNRNTTSDFSNTISKVFKISDVARSLKVGGDIAGRPSSIPLTSDISPIF